MGRAGFLKLPTSFQDTFLTPTGTETSTNLHQKLYYHVLGTEQSEDVLCAEFPDEPKWMGGVEVLYTVQSYPQRPYFLKVHVALPFEDIYEWHKPWE